ncbi:hypothetical protein HK105_202206 [Polyrhizophydium stewartii]|uniref:Uncharacterized protein n=1 Tax=Polyrhizophydium stewartii TaxID=2732419 RepID=A0ABR4NFG6_9FUNG
MADSDTLAFVLTLATPFVAAPILVVAAHAVVTNKSAHPWLIDTPNRPEPLLFTLGLLLVAQAAVATIDSLINWSIAMGADFNPQATMQIIRDQPLFISGIGFRGFIAFSALCTSFSLKFRSVLLVPWIQISRVRTASAIYIGNLAVLFVGVLIVVRDTQTDVAVFGVLAMQLFSFASVYLVSGCGSLQISAIMRDRDFRFWVVLRPLLLMAVGILYLVGAVSTAGTLDMSIYYSLAQIADYIAETNEVTAKLLIRFVDTEAGAVGKGRDGTRGSGILHETDRHGGGPSDGHGQGTHATSGLARFGSAPAESESAEPVMSPVLVRSYRAHQSKPAGNVLHQQVHSHSTSTASGTSISAPAAVFSPHASHGSHGGSVFAPVHSFSPAPSHGYGQAHGNPHHSPASTPKGASTPRAMTPPISDTPPKMSPAFVGGGGAASGHASGPSRVASLSKGNASLHGSQSSVHSHAIGQLTPSQGHGSASHLFGTLAYKEAMAAGASHSPQPMSPALARHARAHTPHSPAVQSARESITNLEALLKRGTASSGDLAFK